MAKKSNYIDNSKFLEAIVSYQAICTKENIPPIPDYIGECFIKIANGLATKSNFINYSYKDEMISDGIENCISYCKNFNPEKSKNPFSYFTQIIYYAFLRRIEKEKKQSYIKYKMTEITSLDELVDSDGNLNIEKSYNVYQHDFSSFDDFERKRKSVRKEKTGKLEEFME